jgi:hypothetical protein
MAPSVAPLAHHPCVTDEVPRPGAERLGRVAMGERLGGFIYGTIVVLAVVVAGAKAYPHGAGHIAALVVVTSVALWLAHVYAHGLAHSLVHDERLSRTELWSIARREGSIVEAALPPVVALLLGALGVFSTQFAVWAALGLGLIVLAVQGVTYARVERLGWLGTLAVVGVNLGIGFLFVGLKLFLVH